MIPAIQRKFTRKTAHPTPAVAITTKDYESQLSPEERYRRHYAMWDFWHAELMEGLGGNSKRAIRAVEEGMAELQALEALLVPEKRAQLAGHVERLERLHQELVKGTMSDTARYRWRPELELQQRTLHHDFAWQHVQEDVRWPDTASPA